MTIYTAIFGKYDDLKEPFVKTKGWKYVCFTDQDLESDVWDIRKVPVMPCGPVKTARYYKLNPHKVIDDECTIWIDATFIVNVNLKFWWRRFKAPFTAIKHPFETCIYKDGEACLDMGKGTRSMVERQIAFYKALGLPRNNGLIASGILMRQRVNVVNDFCNVWWQQVEKWSERDQIAYGYANFKRPGVVNLIEWDYTTQKEFIHIPHLHKSWRNSIYEKAKSEFARASSR